MIVDESDGLHEGITDRGPHEGEAALLEIAREGLGERRLGWHLPGRAATVVEGLAAHEAPQVGGEAAVLALDGEDAPRIVDGRIAPLAGPGLGLTLNAEALAKYRVS